MVAKRPGRRIDADQMAPRRGSPKPAAAMARIEAIL
jgi:hypothetical protein